ncbi:MAG TPA: ribosomal protein S18-alanine N-acetyltransferase [Thermosynechococcaceae cyanobacterium]
MPILHLQPLTADLLPRVVELDRRCFGKLWSLDGYQRELESPNSELLVFTPPLLTPPLLTPPLPMPQLLALGCYWAILEEAHITIVAIDPDYQRQGIGQAMLWALLTSAQKRGLERATLEVKASNEAAIALYQKFGFREAGRRRRYYPTGEDALILWRGDLQYPQFAQTLQQWRQWVDDRLEASGWRMAGPT